jgi:transposase
MTTRRVLYVNEGKDSSVLTNFSQELQRNKGHPDQILEAAIDMSAAFRLGLKREFSSCQITYDKFHLIKIMNEILDKIRREEVLLQPILIGTKYIWLYNASNLTVSQKDALTKLGKRNLKTARAYRYKLALQDIYKNCATIEEVEKSFLKLITWGKKSRLPLLIKPANTLKNHLPGILRHFVSGLTSGVIEGINTKIQEIKRRSRGFPNKQHFMNMIYLALGKLPILKLYGTGLPEF